MIRTVTIIVVICFSFCSCSTKREDIFTVADDQKNIFEHVPRSNLPEVKYGYSVYLKLLAEADIIVRDDNVDKIKKIGKRLSHHATRRGFPYIFTIINDERIFASSTPGGFIYITDGMIEYLNDDSEIAAVLAHEIAQTQRRRIQFTKKKHFAELMQDVSGYAPFVLGPAGIAVPKGVKLVNNLLLTEASRINRVIESDELACRYLQKEKIEVKNLYNVIKRVATAEATIHDKISDYQRLRPITDERIKKLKGIIENARIED